MRHMMSSSTIYREIQGFASGRTPVGLKSDVRLVSWAVYQAYDIRPGCYIEHMVDILVHIP